MAIADEYNEVNEAMIEEFGQAVTFTASGAAAVSVSAILRTGEEMQATVPGAMIEAWVDLGDFTIQPTEYDTVTISAAVLATVGIESATALTFAIRDVLRDSTGGAYLTLQVQR